jgi:hypothetical protein
VSWLVHYLQPAKAKGQMIREIEDNKEFAQWFGEWVARTGQRSTPIEHRRPHQAATVEEQSVVLVPTTAAEVN